MHLVLSGVSRIPVESDVRHHDLELIGLPRLRAGASVYVSNIHRPGCITRFRVVSLRVVDLGALQLVGVVDVDGLPRSEEVDGLGAFAVAVASVLDASEGQVNLRADGRRVDVGDTGLQVADGGEGAVHVPGVKRRRKPVVDGVGDLDGLLECVEFEEADHGAKDLFARDAHIWCDAAEDGGLEEGSLVEVTAGQCPAANKQLGTFARGDADVLLRGLDLFLIDLRADFDRGIEAIADLQLAGALDQAIAEFLYDALLDKDAAGGGAALAGGAEGTP